MVSRSLAVVLLLSTALAYGQLDSNTITVTASRNATLPPDQALFYVSVTAGLNSSLDDVVASLSGLGITSADLVSANGSPLVAVITGAPGLPQPQLTPQITWQFRLAVSISKIKDTVSALTALQKSITQNNSGMTLGFSIQGTQVSTQLQAMQSCSPSDLLSDARAQAQKLAAAANLFLGAVLSMSSPAIAPPPCTLTVKFAITR